MGAFRNRQQQTDRPMISCRRSARRPTRSRRRFERTDDVVDAEFVTVVPTPGRAALSARAATTISSAPASAACSESAVSAARSSALVCVTACWRSAGCSGLRPQAFAALDRRALRAGVRACRRLLRAVDAAGATPPIAAAPLQFTDVTLTPRDANGMQMLSCSTASIDNVTGRRRRPCRRSVPICSATTSWSPASSISPPVDADRRRREPRLFGRDCRIQVEKCRRSRLSFVQAGADAPLIVLTAVL